MARRFEGKVAIVTGSSNGIGRATALLFAEEGARVTITAIIQTTLDLLVAAGLEADNVVQVRGDLTDKAVQKKVVEDTVAKFGKIDIVVNNAGGTAPDMTPDQGFELDESAFDYVVNLNVKAYEIVMVSSIAALPFATFNYPYYNISKAALDQAMRSMACQFIQKGVRVNSVNPGAIATAIGEKQGATEEITKQFASMWEDPKMIPLARIGRPREVAELIAFLADRSKSEFIVGQCMVIDGGSSLLNPIFQNWTDKMR